MCKERMKVNFVFLDEITYIFLYTFILWSILRQIVLKDNIIIILNVFFYIIINVFFFMLEKLLNEDLTELKIRDVWPYHRTIALPNISLKWFRTAPHRLIFGISILTDATHNRSN